MKNSLFPFLLLLAVAGCSDKTVIPPPALRVVKSMTVGSDAGSAEQVRSFGGDIRARHETLAAFRVGGKLVARLVEVGTAVKAGQPLAQLDVADLALRTRETEAQLALAEADAKRYRELRAKNFVSQAAVDVRDTAQKAASAQAAMAQNQADYATLSADHAAVVVEVLAQPGQVVAAGQGVFRLAWEGEREVAIAVPEDVIADIKNGAEAEISLWSAAGKSLRGSVREVAPMADPATRTYAVRISIRDAATLPLGMSATVSFRMHGTSAVVVPMTGLFQHGDQAAVWVIGNDNKLSLRAVRVTTYGDDGVHVAEGLARGERIVTAGVNRLHAGEKVVVADTKAKAQP